ncbi:hypothetical protein [Umezawaea sp. Da 62-37]|uniref:hypothetical protein n=1 Tax=Umezawaea sp. Da 62-37 TaxID=3075927 RepID=UPI0028F721E4|nr:hypothetical protein [Umezawaea sp. Da 62-37]WNV84954.1 hypothetical protein RM788_43500 [Umezawaea sp. Da 62-37]
MLTVIAVVVYVLRFWRIQRRRPMRTHWVTLQLIAPLLPLREVMVWLPDMECQLTDAGPDREHEAIRDIWHQVPALVTSTWGVWLASRADGLHERLGHATMRWADPRITAVNAVLRSPTPTWPRHDLQWAQLQAQWRALRRWTLILSRAVSRRQHPALVIQAAWLANMCRQLLITQAHLGPTPPERQPTSQEVALLLEINHGTFMLAEMLSELGASKRCL